MEKLNEKKLQKFLNQAYRENQIDLVRPTKHYKKQLSDRGIIQSDILFLIKNSQHCKFDYKGPATRNEHKYKLCGRTPNSDRRKICIVFIPGVINDRKGLKIITVMWQDKLGQWGK